ncbi:MULTISPECIES: methyl-accepting chemotaxis protein [unclassified Motilimonas]|uniref:methyl-accepting chemotaxis protein n=1 Tax=unclassified Motilimonas TaxID=2643697 RepID=UPI001E52791B|nr:MULTISPECIES: methyl-accepting chemotaxis protein [unclassified Motilimonas]MCE0556822.1 methyl-accepting chemotaxis protein [Motilimonas sp. E26]MDO6525128.1 methyl-accepting chemotaxis protein [Motilimonas sp. 1_MG-2023]
MKVAWKVVGASSLVLAITITILSWYQYSEMTQNLKAQSHSSIQESSTALSQQITHWLNGKIDIINLVAQVIDSDFTSENIQRVFNSPLLKQEFLLIFGGLDTDGKGISNDPSWQPNDWDARKRPWYNVARNSREAAITEPYADAVTKDILISVVAKFSDKGDFKGAFGGDLSLKVVSEALNTVNFNGSGYAFLLSGAGKVISHPNADFNGKDYSQVFGGKKIALQHGINEVEVNNKALWVSFIPLEGLKGLDWYLAVVVDENIVMASADLMAWQSLFGGVISIIIGIVIIGGVMQSILKPIGLLSSSLLEINSGNGDLTKRLPVISKDEFGEVANQFNLFIGQLQQMITNVKSISNDIRKSTDLTSQESQKAESELATQLAELDQLATAMNQMASSAVEVANSAQVAAQSAQTADTETANGVKIVSKASLSIKNLATEMDQAVATVVELAKYSDNIESILLVITGIAEQTNLLALNAAIEAARAGETGRGFAVVADEVRSLASRTQKSTSEIKTMIEQLQSGVREAETKIKQSREMANETSEEAGKANQALDVIRAAIVQINDMNLQIAAAAEQQSATSEEINRNTTNIRDISQDVSNGALEQVNHCQAMTQQVSEQDTLLSQFKV